MGSAVTACNFYAIGRPASVLYLKDMWRTCEGDVKGCEGSSFTLNMQIINAVWWYVKGWRSFSFFCETGGIEGGFSLFDLIFASMKSGLEFHVEPLMADSWGR